MSVPITIAVSVGAIIALFGLFMVVVVWLGEQRAISGGRTEAVGWPAVIKKIVEILEKWTPKPYRTGVVFIVLGAAIMGVSLALGARGDGDGTTPTPTSTNPPAATETAG
jgi:hypothetical protein